MGCDPRDWIDLAEGRDQLRAYVRAVMNSGFLESKLFRILRETKLQENGESYTMLSYTHCILRLTLLGTVS